MNFPNLKYQSGNFSTPVAVSLPEFSAPFADMGVNIDYVLRQDFMMKLPSSGFPAEAIDTVHPDFPDFLLAREDDKRDMTGGRIRWTRTYAKVPADFSRPSGTYAHTFPAIFVVAATSRVQKPLTVNARVQRDFFHTSTPATIPIIPAQRYVFDAYPELDTDNQVADSPPSVLLTVPSATDYLAMIAGGDEIVPEASSLEQWMGNIWMRSTIYVPAS